MKKMLVLTTIVVLLGVVFWNRAQHSPAKAQIHDNREGRVQQAETGAPGVQLVYYDIAGSTEEELRAELNAKGPVGVDHFKGDATTKWSIRWNWPGYGTSSCDLSHATVSYEITVILPRWQPAANSSPALVDKWTAYARALVEHERGHADFVVTNHHAILSAIKSATCETATAAAEAVLQSIRQHDVDYDAATAHGATQGARFP